MMIVSKNGYLRGRAAREARKRTGLESNTSDTSELIFAKTIFKNCLRIMPAKLIFRTVQQMASTSRLLSAIRRFRIQSIKPLLELLDQVICSLKRSHFTIVLRQSLRRFYFRKPILTTVILAPRIPPSQFRKLQRGLLKRTASRRDSYIYFLQSQLQFRKMILQCYTVTKISKLILLLL